MQTTKQQYTSESDAIRRANMWHDYWEWEKKNHAESKECVTAAAHLLAEWAGTDTLWATKMIDKRVEENKNG